ncbi:SIR2 family protein [Agrobacterium fabrum]|uniref:SIR2 family protein n=1 Tax=Agrobacterium fabrum TaxID=1176649 RepID=UPI001571AB47|nr:SIR2 family protein [Agrobacterium fabrum]WCK80145.1 SIR2 family protein [Agrobacterium fabrum]
MEGDIVKFAESGADIPDELIDSTLAGDVVFLCGAGVSKRVGLPLFGELTDQIYEELGETFEEIAPEREPYEKQEFDRTLGALEKRIRRAGSLFSPVRAACAKHLASPFDIDLPDHEAIMVLSRDKEGQIRVLTTNFDTLFERAAAKRSTEVRSDAMRSLPKPGSNRDIGIHHLHGRIADPSLGLSETELILTSADFGDAYLRDGWASRYIEDRMRTATLVLVGYRAEDAALRLLLETLDVDRVRFSDLRNVYALDQSKKDSSAQWRSKGIIPVEFDSRDELYQSLKEWARYVERPTEFEQQRIEEIFARPAGAVSEFEKSQLLSLLRRGNVAPLLLKANPSLAWLSVLADLRLVQHDQRLLASWIGKNLHDADAVKEVVGRLPLFGKAAAESLQFALNQNAGALPPYLVTAWRLIIRHMENAADPELTFGWFDLQPVLLRGDRSANTIERLAKLLQPKLRVSKPFRLYDDREAAVPRFQDLVRVEYEVEEHISIEEVQQGWGAGNSAQADAQLLAALSHELDAALADAVDFGLESEQGYGITDANVASVAHHGQNRFRAGFLPIVRVMAEVCAALISKEPDQVRKFALNWIGSPYRINHRLALFAVANPLLGPELVNQVLIQLPAAELFLGGSTVEVHRLLAERWYDLSKEARATVEDRVRIGPPASWFRPGADIAKYVDRTRFDLIGDLERGGIVLSPETQEVRAEIHSRWPDWILRRPERAGFHSWHSSGQEVQGEIDADLSRGEASGTESNVDWKGLCEANPAQAFDELLTLENENQWRPEAWREFLLLDKIFEDPQLVCQIARKLVELPDNVGEEITSLTIRWLGRAEVLGLDQYRWPLWDTVFQAALRCEEGDGNNGSAFERAWISPVGDTVALLLRMVPPSEDEAIFHERIEPRLNNIVSEISVGGGTARVRLASEANFLFDRAPKWTKENLLVGFEWSSPEAVGFWSARHYSSSIGGTKLFSLMKGPFLQLFGRHDLPPDMQKAYAGWLFSILVANRADKAGYDLSAKEARAALRRTNPMILQALAHDVAVSMQKVEPHRKREYWHDVIGPVFVGLWPMDVEMLSGAVTFKLLQILRASGETFPSAADTLLPFIRPEEKDQGTAIHSLGKADDIIFQSAPDKLLAVVAAAAGDKLKGSVYGLRLVLDRIAEADPNLVNGRSFQRLLQMARND